MTISPPAPIPNSSTSSHEQVLTAFKALGFALSARALLLIALIGAFILAVMAMWSQTLPALEVLAAYGIFVMLPAVWLEVRRRVE